MSGSIEGRRRRSARDPSRRVAEYTIAGTDSTWRPCRLIDVSLMGVGLDFVDAAPPAAAVGCRITFRLLNAEGQPNGIVFYGEIRNIERGPRDTPSGRRVRGPRRDRTCRTRTAPPTPFRMIIVDRILAPTRRARPRRNRRSPGDRGQEGSLSRSCSGYSTLTSSAQLPVHRRAVDLCCGAGSFSRRGGGGGRG